MNYLNIFKFLNIEYFEYLLENLGFLDPKGPQFQMSRDLRILFKKVVQFNIWLFYKLCV